MATLLIALQLIVALGIINVWLLRCSRPTPYRGGAARTMREEFHAYGLPFPVMCIVGALKLSCVLALILAIWFPALAQPAALVLGTLMLGALGMHLKIGDPFPKSVPALLLLTLCVAIAFLPLLTR